MEPLLDRVPPKPFPTVRAIVEAELHAPLDTIFSSFEEVPLAAASIGQVHRATLREGGTPVVVKVMYQEVEAHFRGDVATARFFAEVALPEHVAALKEIEKQFANEFDYRREAAQLKLVGANLAATSFDVIVPSPVLPLCTKSVLVMTEVPRAERLAVALARDVDAFALEAGVTPAAFLAAERVKNEEALARGHLRCGPDARTMDAVISFRRWRNALAWPLAWLGVVPPAHVPLNHARLVDDLLAIHGHEILVDGAFNGDPHPGNLLLSDRRLALVDYGQVKILTPDMRLRLARLLVALAAADPASPADRARVASCMTAMGFATAKGDPDVSYAVARVFFDRSDSIVTGGLHVQQFLEKLSAADAVTSIGDDYVLVARASLMLRGLAGQLNQHRSTAVAWRPLAERVLREAGEDPGGAGAVRL